MNGVTSIISIVLAIIHGIQLGVHQMMSTVAVVQLEQTCDLFIIVGPLIFIALQLFYRAQTGTTQDLLTKASNMNDS